MSGKYFGIAQVCGSIMSSVKEKCAPCFHPVEWCGIGIDEGLSKGEYDVWLNQEATHLDRYQQKPLKGDIIFHDMGAHVKKEDDSDAESADEDMGLNAYNCAPLQNSPSSTTKARMFRIRYGVKRGLKRVSSKLRRGKGKKSRFGVKTMPEGATIRTYPTQELAETRYLYPVQEEADGNSSLDSSLSSGDNAVHLL